MPFTLSTDTASLALTADEPCGYVKVTLGEGREEYLVGITRTDEGIVLDLFTPDGQEELASTYAYDSDPRPE